LPNSFLIEIMKLKYGRNSWYTQKSNTIFVRSLLVRRTEDQLLQRITTDGDGRRRRGDHHMPPGAGRAQRYRLARRRGTSCAPNPPHPDHRPSHGSSRNVGRWWSWAAPGSGSSTRGARGCMLSSATTPTPACCTSPLCVPSLSVPFISIPQLSCISHRTRHDTTRPTTRHDTT
jgi:hypothetical protein